MSGFIAYTRVSTVKQGEKGVSLVEQREAILRYSERNGLSITTWLQEMVTAAKQGRPAFNTALKMLRERSAQGIIMHKLDRGARNLKDWVTIGDLSDAGAEIHFVNEGLDLQSRGGRLSADIQAVVAADYIRNLREETRKGFYGRLKQGFYPIRAPLGYRDQGKAKAKTIDPISGPLVRRAFELYETRNYSVDSLREELHKLGLRNKSGGALSRNGISTILHNTFYTGVITLHKTREQFRGIHEPLVSEQLFRTVQDILAGRVVKGRQRRGFLFSRLLTCASCNYSLIGERQKNYVYYRCHSKQCSGTSVREESVCSEVEKHLRALVFTDAEKEYLKSRLLTLRTNWDTTREVQEKGLNLRLGHLKAQLVRLTDIYIQGSVEKALFDEKRSSLLSDQETTAKALKTVQNVDSLGTLEKFLELAANPWLSHTLGNREQKRQILQSTTSNRLVRGKNVELEPSLPFREIANRATKQDCDPNQDTPRTLDKIFDNLVALNDAGELPDLSELFGCEQKSSELEKKPKRWKHDERGKFTKLE